MNKPAIGRLHLLERMIRSRAKVNAPLILGRARIYIFPTGAGFAFILVLLFLLIGSINYGRNLGYAVTFLLASLFVSSIFYAFRNLNGLSIDKSRIEPVFCGQTLLVPLHFSNPSTLARVGLQVQIDSGTLVCTNLETQANIRLDLPMPTSQRGKLALGQIKLATTFPLSLVNAWTILDFDLNALVYPKAAEQQDITRHQGFIESQDDTMSTLNGDQFDGIRVYQRGDQFNRIFWKAIAKEQGLYSKDFRAHSSHSKLVDWFQLGDLDTEKKLSIMCALLLECEHSGADYALRLPSAQLAPNHGKTHLHACLKLLALYPDTSETSDLKWQKVA